MESIVYLIPMIWFNWSMAFNNLSDVEKEVRFGFHDLLQYFHFEEQGIYI